MRDLSFKGYRGNAHTGLDWSDRKPFVRFSFTNAPSMKTAAKTSFKQATKLGNIWNKITEWNGYTLAVVGWHRNPWKVIQKDVDFNTVADREYQPISEFRTQEDLWKWIKNKCEESTK